jgi:hypothetical protein
VLEALTTKHGSPLCRFEGDGRLDAAFRALSASLGSRESCHSGTRTWTQHCRACAFELAGFASLGIVLELFVEEEKLFASGEDELTTAICAG